MRLFKQRKKTRTNACFTLESLENRALFAGDFVLAGSALEAAHEAPADVPVAIMEVDETTLVLEAGPQTFEARGQQRENLAGEEHVTQDPSESESDVGAAVENQSPDDGDGSSSDVKFPGELFEIDPLINDKFCLPKIVQHAGDKAFLLTCDGNSHIITVGPFSPQTLTPANDGRLDPSQELPSEFVIRPAIAGDADLNGKFDSSDLVKIFQTSEYEDSIVGNSSWSTGDWNGDGEFDSSDLVMAFQDGNYENHNDQDDVPDVAYLHPVVAGVILLGEWVGGLAAAYYISEAVNSPGDGGWGDDDVTEGTTCVPNNYDDNGNCVWPD
ncbi:MAG: hypothetical protein KDB27_16895 [Planctomycetales bacterium]|nr:hypothetical protein [Planctomycetales bacterium]